MCDREKRADLFLALLTTGQSHSRRPATQFGPTAQLFQTRVSRTRDPTRRCSRGAKSRFGPLVDGPCPLQKAAEDGGDPGAAGTFEADLRA